MKTLTHLALVAVATLTACIGQTQSPPIPEFVDPVTMAPADGLSYRAEGSLMKIELSGVNLRAAGFKFAHVFRAGELVQTLTPEPSGVDEVVWLFTHAEVEGAYEVRVELPAGFDARRVGLLRQFGSNQFGVRFWLGSKFCLPKLSFCTGLPSQDARLNLTLSKSPLPLTRSEFESAVRVAYDGKDVACSVSGESPTVRTNAPLLVCPLVPNASGRLTVSFVSPPLLSASSTGLEECGSTKAMPPVELTYVRGSCVTYSW